MQLFGRGLAPQPRGASIRSHHHQQPCPSPACSGASTSGRHATVDFAISQQGCTHYRQHASGHRRSVQVEAAGKRKSAPPAEEAPSQDAEQAEPTKAASTRAARDQKITAPEILERGGPEHPYPGDYQQTLITSFTLGGVGLHTGDYATVRVRPAFAGEGRYFVRVDAGSNADRLDTTANEPIEVELEDGGQMPIDPELEEKKVALFKEFLVAQEDDGFAGTFKQFLHEVDAQDLISRWEAGEDPQSGEWQFPEAEEIQGRGDGEGVLAHIDNIHIPAAVTVTLGDLTRDAEAVVGVELILAALEATGVDNARIEIEGGMEIPQLDGSALGWAMEIQFAGLRPAPRGDGHDGYVRREAARYQGEPFIVTQGDAYISFVPEDNMRVTAGLDHHMGAESIGKQWKSWSIFEDLPFRFELAGARRWLANVEHLQIMSAYGFFQGGTQGTLMIADGDSWLDPNNLRHVHDEAARFEVMLTLGVLALNARPGHAGMPFGHVTSYKATPQLRLKFVNELQKRVDPDCWKSVWDVPLNVDPDVDQVFKLMEFNRVQMAQMLRDELGEVEGEGEGELEDDDEEEFEELDEGQGEGEEDEGEGELGMAPRQ